MEDRVLRLNTALRWVDVLNVGEDDDLLKLRRQTTKRVQHFFLQNPLRRRRREGDGFGDALIVVIDESELGAGAAAFAVHVIHDRDEPSATIRSRLKAMKRLQSLRESL